MPAQVSRIARLMNELTPNQGLPTVTGAYQMSSWDHFVNFAVNAVYTITLPPVFECKGQFYLLKGVGAGTSIVTVVDKGDSIVAVSDTMNAANEVMMVYSDGEMWHFIITPPA